jgi:hypothetical protein
MQRVVMFSGGEHSYGAAKRVAEKYGATGLSLLFTDTLIEDEDLYRFVVEAGADVLGRQRSDWTHLKGILEGIPGVEQHAARAVYLKDLSRQAMEALPGLYWVQDGRDPWDVFRDVRFLGNTRVAKCSHVLKQDRARRWLEENCDPADTTIYLGIHWSEGDRFFGSKTKSGARELWSPWRCEAPLCESPLIAATAPASWLESAGIRRPRLYAMGFPHNNCAGFCVKAGQAHFRNLLVKFPERYAYHERREEELRTYLGKDVAILRDRRGGKLTPLTMAKFRQRVEEGWKCDLFDWGGCGCFSSPREESSSDAEVAE